MLNLVLAALLAAPALGAAKLDADTLAMVRVFLKMPTENLPPDNIDRFLAVDADALPKKLRKPFLAKRLELYTFRQLAEGKKRGPYRAPGHDCARPQEAAGNTVGILLMAGYEKITPAEELYLEKKTECTEMQLMCEFTLQLIISGKGRNADRQYLLHVKDPLMAYLGEYRAGAKNNPTNFFGSLKPTCTK